MKKIKLKELITLEEIDILYPKPKKIPVGDKYIIIKEISLHRLDRMGKVAKGLMRKYRLLNDLKVPEDPKELVEKTEEFEDIVDVIDQYLRIPRFRKIFVRILRIAMPEMDKRGFISSKYVYLNITHTEALQTLLAIWIYNYVSDCKKKVKALAKNLLEV